MHLLEIFDQRVSLVLKLREGKYVEEKKQHPGGFELTIDWFVGWSFTLRATISAHHYNICI